MGVAINCSRWFTMTMVTMAMGTGTGTGTGTDTGTDTMTAPMLTWNVSLATSAMGQAKRGIITVTTISNNYQCFVCMCIGVGRAMDLGASSALSVVPSASSSGILS